jgi:hypothetical protein
VLDLPQYLQAMAGQERSIALNLEYMRRRYPGVEPGKRRRGLISAATECSEPAGGSRGKFLEPEAARSRGWSRPSAR